MRIAAISMMLVLLGLGMAGPVQGETEADPIGQILDRVKDYVVWWPEEFNETLGDYSIYRWICWRFITQDLTPSGQQLSTYISQAATDIPGGKLWLLTVIPAHLRFPFDPVVDYPSEGAGLYWLKFEVSHVGCN